MALSRSRRSDSGFNYWPGFVDALSTLVLAIVFLLFTLPLPIIAFNNKKLFPEIKDGITVQILSVFPGFVLQQHLNCLAVRQVLPKGTDHSELNWTYLGYIDDTPELRTVRLKQLNLVGPAGFISMEDGCVGGFVERGIAGAADLDAVVEMGGDATTSSEGRATEAAIRGFWKVYRQHMGQEGVK